MYNKTIKFDILTTEGILVKKQCYEAFLLGLLKGSRYRTYVNVKGKLAKTVLDTIKDNDEFVVKYKLFPISVRYYKKSLHIRGFDMLEFRKNFIKQILSDKAKDSPIAFLQGLFISCGYIQNPEKNYHMEFKIKEKWIKSAFIRCENKLKLKFCRCEKGNFTRFYIKSGKILVKFLSLIGLFDRASELSDLIEARAVLSGVNRKVNIETSNINKSISASERCIANIKNLLLLENQDFWNENLIETAKMRIKFPHDSLEQLGKRFSPTLSKSAINHRLRKINSIYEKLQN